MSNGVSRSRSPCRSQIRIRSSIGLDGDRVELAARPLEVEAVADVFEHHPERGDAVIGQPGEVGLDGGHVPTADQALQLGPGQGVVLADDQERLAVLGLEVAAARPEPDPGELGRPAGLSGAGSSDSPATVPGASGLGFHPPATPRRDARGRAGGRSGPRRAHPRRDQGEATRLTAPLLPDLRRRSGAPASAAGSGFPRSRTDSTTRFAERIAPSWLRYFHSPNRPIGKIPLRVQVFVDDRQVPGPLGGERDVGVGHPEHLLEDDLVPLPPEVGPLQARHAGVDQGPLAPDRQRLGRGSG